MAVQGFKTATVRPKGLTDAVDGSNTFPGAMAALQNLIPAPHTPSMWVPRPASALVTSFSGFTSPAQIECLLVVGNIIYGLIASGLHSGRSQPFAYNLSTGVFQTITGMLAGNLPTTAASSGDWEPPTAALVGSRVVFTHPGFSGGNLIGWLDISGFTSSTVTGTTHGTKTLDTLSVNVLQAGWNVGMAISSSAGDIPAGTTITAIAADGKSCTLSNAATGSNAGDTLTVFGGSATSPQWAAGNTNGFGLVSRPVAVFQFNGRAWFAVGTGRQFSDSGNATQITSASQALTNQNGLPDTAFGGLPVAQTTGGVLQALIAFQGAGGIKMITGDLTTSNLAVNEVGSGQGTVAPNTIVQTNRGLLFVAPDGLRMIDLYGNVTEPVGAQGHGVEMAFIQAIFPSRMCAAFNGDTYRVTVQNGYVEGQPVQEFWYHLSPKVWSGPHTFPAALIAPWPGSSGNGFVIAPNGMTGQLWQGNATPGANDSFTENGSVLSWEMSTLLLPDTQFSCENVMVQATLTCGLGNSQSVQVEALDEFGAVLDNPTISGGGGTVSVWGAFLWGAGVWSSASPKVVQRPIYWTQPIQFKQLQIQFTGSSAAGMTLGNINTSYKPLGYQTAQQG